MKTHRSIEYRQLYGYAWRERYRLAVILLLTCVLALFAALEPLPMKLLVDNALSGAPLPTFLARVFQGLGGQPDAWVLVVMAALASWLIMTAGAAVAGAVSWSWAFAGQRMVVDLTTDPLLSSAATFTSVPSNETSR